MAHGGKRPGAGRRKGSLTTKTRAIAEKATAEGLTPLEVMLKAMRRHADAEQWDEAAAHAKDAAPYIHPKLAAVQHTGRDGGPILTADLSKLSNDQLATLELVFGPLAGSGDDDGSDPGGEGPASS
jgi:hypothetical protein